MAFRPNTYGFALNSPLTARFSEPMAAASVTNQTAWVRISGVDVAGLWQLDATGLRATFVPAAAWTASRTVQVTFTAGMTDLTGTPLAAVQSPR